MKKSLSKEKVEIVDGSYNSLWGGYQLDILSSDGGILVSIPTIDGVRGMNCPTKVEVIDGYVYEIYEPYSRS